MNKSIQHFNEKSTKELGIIAKKFFEDPTKLDEMVDGVLETLLSFGLNLIKETLEDADESIRQSPKRSLKWNINRKEQTQLLCRLGNVVYERTLFQEKKDKTYHYLLDDLMGIDAHTRITAGAEAALLEETIDSSYRKGGMNVSLCDAVSKQTVKNKVHALVIPEAPNIITEKKKVEVLYIDADEDHISKQFEFVKGDIKKTPNGNKYNTMLGKMIYVYEGVRLVHEKSNRKELIGKRYFGGIYSGVKGNAELWEKVSEYIANTYDSNTLKTVYINGDGADWIKAGTNYIPHSKFVLDQFHLMKYINQATSHLLDSTADAKTELYAAINGRHKKELIEIFDRIIAVTETDTKIKSVLDAKTYIINHWHGITVKIKNSDIIGCSAEGHISHTFSARMSSRPMGWSEHGANQMCKLRCYKANGGNIIELVKEQQELKATGTEGKAETLKTILGNMTKKRNTDDYYINRIQATIPGYSAIKQIAISTHISNL